MKRGVQVRVPATSANLGPGFDTLGLALDWHDVVTARVVERTPTAEGMPTARAAGRTTVEVSGEGAGVLPGDEHHLVARTMRETFDLLRVRADELELRCENSVPHGRGLGSSAAAIVAGVLAARALAAADTGQLPDDAVLALAARIEGHADNVAACLLGGLTIAWTSHQVPRAIRLEVHPELRAIACVPEPPLATAAARALLPAAVPHADAARNAASAALIVEALTRRPELLLDATHDLLHQQYRAPAMPDSLTLVAELRARGLAAVVSGAGPSVVVLSTGADDLASVVEVTGQGSWQVRQLEVDHRGAVVESM